MDGSAAPFVALIRDAGIVEQNACRRFLRVLRTVTYSDGQAVATLRPYDGFRVEYTMHYDHPFFADQCQHAAVDVCAATFARDVSRARTFGFLADMDALRAKDMAQGGSLDNAIVVDDDGILNEDGLRYDDEFVKHKILDAIGDLYLCGQPILGAFLRLHIRPRRQPRPAASAPRRPKRLRVRHPRPCVGQHSRRVLVAKPLPECHCHGNRI